MKNNQNKILIIGFNTIDIVLTINEKIKIGEKMYADSLLYYCGGQAANCAYTLSKLGCDVVYVGKFGDDSNGILSLDSLKDANISIEKSKIIENCSNHIGIIAIDNSTGERTIVMRKDERLSMDNENLSKKDFDNIRLVYTDGNESAFSLHVAKLASELGIEVVSDIERIDDNIINSLPYISTLIAPSRIIMELANEKDLKLSLKKMSIDIKTVVATDGKNGSFGINHGGEIIYVPAEECHVKDTTGAGDAYHAGYISAMLKGKKFLECLQTATHIAKLKCEIAGPRITKEKF